MADGTVRRVAVIINGNGDQPYLENVERAGKLFRENGYELFVASPQRPAFDTDFYSTASTQGVAQLIDELKKRAADNDEVVIYTTGKGSEKKDGCLGLENTCLSKDSYTFRRLFSLPYGRRTIVMTQYFAENWARLFADDLRTLFISSSSPDAELKSLRGAPPHGGTTKQSREFSEIASLPSVARNDKHEFLEAPSNKFDSLLFAPDSQIPNRNADSTITWHERFAYTVNHVKQGVSIFIPNTHYYDTGINGSAPEPGHFEPKVYEVSVPQTLKSHLSRLKRDDVAVIFVSAPWCEPCKQYVPQFEDIAKSSDGRALFLYIPDGHDEKWKSLEIHSFPAVILVDSHGNKARTWSLRDPLIERWMISGAHFRDRSFCLSRIREFESNFKKAAANLRMNRNFVLEAIEQNWKVLKYVDQRFQKDPEIVMIAFKKNVDALKFADPSLKKNPKFMLDAIQENCFAIDYADPTLKKDPKFAALKKLKRQGDTVCRYLLNK
jgi:thiol-disulfide isomerase/thioredoxin